MKPLRLPSPVAWRHKDDVPENSEAQKAQTVLARLPQDPTGHAHAHASHGMTPGPAGSVRMYECLGARTSVPASRSGRWQVAAQATILKECNLCASISLT